jgi:hypothetical protein
VIFKFLKALLEWLFAPRFYYHHKGLAKGTQFEYAQIRAEMMFRGKLRYMKCKQCGIEFCAFKKNDTCPSVVCFFKYRLKGV